MAAATTNLGVETFEGPREHDRPVRSELTRSATELIAYFTSALGVSAQPYESSGGSSGVADFDKGIVRELDDAAMNDRATRTQAFDAARATLAKLPIETRQVLERVYVPWGTGFAPSRKQAEEQRSRSRTAKEEPVAPDFLSIALSPKSLGGSFVRLAIMQPRTLAAFEKQHPGRPSDPAARLLFLVAEAGKGEGAASFFRKLKEDCEAPRTLALIAYDALRIERTGAESATRRQRRDDAAKASAAFFESTLEAKSHRARNRLAKLRDLETIDLSSQIYADKAAE